MKKAMYFENGLEPEILGSENQENEIETSETETNIEEEIFNAKKISEINL